MKRSKYGSNKRKGAIYSHSYIPCRTDTRCACSMSSRLTSFIVGWQTPQQSLRKGACSYSYLAELTHGVPHVVGADELEVLDRGYCHPTPEVEAVVSFREGGFPRLEEEHAAVAALVHVRQLDKNHGGGIGEESGSRAAGNKRRAVACVVDARQRTANFMLNRCVYSGGK